MLGHPAFAYCNSISYGTAEMYLTARNNMGIVKAALQGCLQRKAFYVIAFKAAEVTQKENIE